MLEGKVQTLGWKLEILVRLFGKIAQPNKGVMNTNEE